VMPGAPKYDPNTGELVRPMDIDDKVLPPEEEAAVPMATRSMTYASPDLDAVVSPFSAMVLLLKPINLLVMFFVVIAHGLMLMTALIAAFGIFFIVPLLIGVLAILLAHYGIVVDEIGPVGRDELPRPMRQCGWQEDLWGPFVHMAGAIMISFIPAFLVLRSPTLPSTLSYPLAAVVGLVGAFFFPAIFLTTATSGSVHNLRPDRIMGVIARCGLPYFFAAMLFPVASSIYFLGILGTGFQVMRNFIVGRPAGPWYFASSVAFPALFLGIYLMHYFCFFLGLMYRKHHDHFPWAFQRHIPTRLRDRVAGVGLTPPPRPRAKKVPVDRATARKQTLEQLQAEPRNQRRQPES
jgi:hypothetical protein